MTEHYSVANLRQQGRTDAVTDDPSLRHELREFMAELRVKMPWLKFLSRSRNEVYVYTDTCPYALGFIGYADYSAGEKYMVYSRTIENNKFSSTNRQHNMLLSSNIGVAVRNARTHLRVYSTTELAARNMGELSTCITDANATMRNQLSSSRRFVTDGISLLLELRNLVESGHVFSQPGFDKEVRRFIEAADHMNAAEQQELHHVYVYVTEDWRGQVFNMQRMKPCKGSYAGTMRVDTNHPPTDLPVAEVDPLILGRVSVLSMLDDKSYVAGVGMRITEDSFYVQV
jgi:hypothetical protein